MRPDEEGPDDLDARVPQTAPEVGQGRVAPTDPGRETLEGQDGVPPPPLTPASPPTPRDVDSVQNAVAPGLVFRVPSCFHSVECTKCPAPATGAHQVPGTRNRTTPPSHMTPSRRVHTSDLVRFHPPPPSTGIRTLTLLFVSTNTRRRLDKDLRYPTYRPVPTRDTPAPGLAVCDGRSGVGGVRKEETDGDDPDPREYTEDKE